MEKKLKKIFFERPVEVVAKDLVGKILVRIAGRKVFKGKIVETEAYFGEKDPSSWARFGKRKDNFHMWGKGGTILIKNVHKHLMLNFVTGKEGKAQAVLIRAIEPLNFNGNSSGPGRLTKTFLIDRKLNGERIYETPDFFVMDSGKEFNIGKSFRIGVKKDLKRKMRFFIKGNKFVSRR